LKVDSRGSPNPEKVIKTKMLRPSDVRLKVRNIDEKQVTNDDLKVSIYHMSKIFIIETFRKNW